MRLPLTDEQKTAATSGDDYVYIEASPGSGKTTVATERYGVCRYTRCDGERGVLALSFARSARGELHERVMRRWGSAAMRWPHKVWTLDHLHAALIHHLLASGALRWPGGHTELEIVDTWRGHAGSRPLAAGAYRCGLFVADGEVRIGSSANGPATHTFSVAGKYRERLEEAMCTHEEIRQVLQSAISKPSSLQDIVSEYLRGTISSLIVDEVFDGNRLDLQIVHRVASVGVPTTLIGDPWQALYAFRGAVPNLVPTVVNSLAFTACPLTASFRFETVEMQALAASLRLRQPVTVPPGATDECDVVLSSEWSRLWSCPSVLPLSFGQVTNRVDAAIAILLDHVVTRRFRALSSFGPDAAVILGLDDALVRAEGAERLAPVMTTLTSGIVDAPATAFAELKSVLIAMGSKNITSLAAPKMTERYERLRKVSERATLAQPVPGLTIHQAKGREWRRVGVALSAAELVRLAAGLDETRDGDRTLYVGLTRARESTCWI